MNELNEKVSNLNYKSFIWHGAFLALASSFMDVDTIMPAMLGEAGGKAIHMGILVMIMMGGSSFSQIFFAPYLHNKNFKKKFLLIGINLRILALVAMTFLFYFFDSISNPLKLWFVLILTSLFSFSGAFANISYTDIIGKSIFQNKRKSFLSLKKLISAVGLLISAIMARKILQSYNVPQNYIFLFIFASLFLFIASFGFWKLKEIKGKAKQIHNIKEFFLFMKKEIKQNKKLRNYLLLMNTLGVSITLMPFLILFAKENLTEANIFLGNLLFIKVVGGILISSILFYFSKKFKYTYTLYSIILLSFSILLIVFFSSIVPWLFYLSFFLSGLMFVIYSITINGILLEITHNENRAIYTGLVGAGNIIPTIFPLFGGWIIKNYSFNIFFLLIASIILISIYYIKNLNCSV